MTQQEERSISQFRCRVGLLCFLKYGLLGLTVWAFLLGTLVLALRGSLGTAREDLLLGLASFPLALLPAIVLTYLRLPSPASVRALLDRHGRCGGLLMAGAEHSLGDWQTQVPALTPPQLRWRGGRTGVLFACGVAFVLLAFLLPQSLANLGGTRLDLDRESDALAKQIEVLEQEKVLEKQRAGELKASLEQVKREANGKDPIKSLESLDHLKDLAHKSAQDAAESTTRKMEDLARAETFAEAMEKMAGKMEKGELTKAMHEMAALAKKAASEKELLESGLDPATLEAIKNSTLTPEQTKKLLEALKNAKEGEMGKIGRLVKAKLLDADALEKCEKAGKCDCAALAEYLKENGANTDLTAALALLEEPGMGGVTRGPGPAKIEFGDESSEAGAKFKEEELPQGQLQSLKESQLSGISSGTPQVNRNGPAKVASGALNDARSGGGSASTQVVLPRHRGSVERYFERMPAPAKK